MVSLVRLRQVLSYEPKTGIFLWRVQKRGFAKPGKMAGGIQKDGYRTIMVDGRHYFAHRLAWLYMTGDWPGICIDHINATRDDNRWSNLREATVSQNGANKLVSRFGLKGVTKKDGKYQAQIKKNGAGFYLGLFASEQEAHAAYLRAAEEKHGKFARAA